MSKEEISDLLDIYRIHPCQFLPNAFWKTAKGMAQSRLDVERASDGTVTSFAIWGDSQLLSFWCREPSFYSLDLKKAKRISFALVHEDSLPIFERFHFPSKIPYFRIMHKEIPPNHECPSRYEYQTVSPQTNLVPVASFINQCYENIKVNEKIVNSWLNHPVYDPKLWVWIKDTQNNQFAALGIAELDECIPEASLEWIQVHPKYQKRGLAKALVSELLRRVRTRVEFTTVSGEMNNPSNPEKLYRQLGFCGSDVWWLMKD